MFQGPSLVDAHVVPQPPREVRELLRLVGGELVSTSASDPEKYSLQGWVALPDPLTCRPPPIMSFNRAHLPVLLARHLASLEEELGSCPNPMRRIKLLLREPLLLLSVAHREFVRQQLEGNAFTLRNMKPMLQCMQAQRLGPGDGTESLPRQRVTMCLRTNPALHVSTATSLIYDLHVALRSGCTLPAEFALSRLTLLMLIAWVEP